MQANHAQSLNCLAFDLIKNAFRNLLHVAVKNKTLFEPHDYFVFPTDLGASLFCFSVMEQIRSIFYTTCPPWRSLDFRWLLFSSRKKVTNIRMKVKIKR